MAKKRFYPSKRGGSKDINFALLNGDSNKKPLDLSAPFRFSDSKCEAVHKEWQTRFSDSWINPIANVGVNNSLMQYNQNIDKRLSYSECAFLANDPIINNALSKIANEILRKGGDITIETNSDELQNEIKKSLESRLKELDFWQILHKAIITSLTYGGALIYLDINAKAEDLATPLVENARVFAKNKIHALKVVEPYLCGANEVNATNPLNADFMIPNLWYISGGGQIHKSRVATLIMYPAPDMIKPLYNYLGISLCQFMRDYVASADISRQGLADIFSRFRTKIVKTPLIKNDINTARARAEAINRQQNNNSLILLTEDEEYIETITSITGLDKLIAQMQENIAISARIPAVKLLGLTPSGFNATGDFDMRSYYDEIMSIQNAIIKPLIEKILYLLCLEMGFENIRPEYNFEPLNKETAINEAQVKATEANTINALIQSGIITQEQGFDYLREREILPKSAKFESENADLDLDLNSDDLGLQGTE